ncbi:MAG: ATP-binding protein [Sedimenticola sp.]
MDYHIEENGTASHVSDELPNYQDYRRRFDGLITAYSRWKHKRPGSTEVLLDQYQSFTEEWDKNHPLILNDGDPIQLDRTPSQLYLLPQLPNASGGRFVLCQFPPEFNHDQSVQLIRWYPDIDDQSQLEPVNSQPWPVPKFSSHSLAHRAVQVTLALDEDGEFTLRLIYPTAVCKIRWMPDEKPQIQWVGKDVGEGIHWHRCSHGMMAPVLGVKPCTSKEGWQDDELWLPDSDVPLNHQLGRVTGADKPNGCERVYISSGRARLYAIDISRQGSLIKTEKRLGAVALDILVVPHPEKENHHAVLTLCDDSTAWVFEDGESVLKHVDFQLLSEKIIRVIGYGDASFLGMDMLGRLRPLRLNRIKEDERVIRKIRKDVWGTQGHDLLAHHVNEIFNEEQPVRSDEAMLVLDCYLDFLGDEDESLLSMERLENIEYLFTSVNSYQLRANEDHRYKLHEGMLSRVWSFLRTRLYRLDATTFKRGANDWVPLWALVNLHENAPLALWLSVLRHHDWLLLLRDEINRTKTPLDLVLGNAFDRFFKHIGHHRRSLEPCLGELRPILVHSSHRIGSQPRHLRLVSREKRLIAYLDYREGVRLTRFPSGKEQSWKQLDLLRHKGHWEGVPRAIISGGRLQSLFTKISYPTMICTDRGEIKLYSIEEKVTGQHTFGRCVWESKLPLDIRACHPIKHPDGNRWLGLLVAGQDYERRAAIYWLGVDQQTGLPEIEQIDRPVWRDSLPGGQIRMMKVAGNPQPALWAIDRNLGKLYFWKIYYSFGRPIKLNEFPIEKLDRQIGIHALSMGTDKQGGTLLITGGKRGLAISFNANNGTGHLTSRWAAGCGKQLNRVIPIKAANDHDYWLLCSEHMDVQIVDKEQGRLEGALVDIGPVSAARCCSGGGGGDEAIIGTTHGRIIVVKPVDSQGNDSKRAEHASLSPMAILGIRRPETLALLEHLNELDWCGNNHPDWLYETPPTAVAVALRKKWTESSVGNITIKPELWRIIAQKRPNTPICRLVTLLQEMVEELIERGETPMPEWAFGVVSCIWAGKQCPELMLESRREVLKLAEAIRIAALVTARSMGMGQAETINAWLKQMQSVWNVVANDRHRERLQGYTRAVLIERIPLFSGEEKWQEWLFELVEGKEPDYAPGLLSSLWDASLKSFAETTITGLKQLFPTPWSEWLSVLQSELEKLEKLQSKTVSEHNAWGEKVKLAEVAERIDQGRNQFLSSDGLAKLPLVAIFWPVMRNRWQCSIEGRVAELERNSVEHKEYIRIKPEIDWIDASRARLKLMIYNYSTVDISLISWGLDSNAVNTRPWEETERCVIASGKRYHPVEMNLTMDDSSRNRIVAKVILGFLAGDTQHEIYVELDYNRKIDMFKENPGFFESSERLLNLIAQGKDIIWLKGDYWNDDEQETILKNASQVALDNIGFVEIEMLQLALEEDKRQRPIFSPSLPLSASDSIELAYALHPLLHDSGRQRYKPLALSLWHWARPLPVPVSDALKGQLVPESEVEELLERLLGGEVSKNRVKEGIRGLPDCALGAWCAGEPVNGLTETDASGASALLGKEVLGVLSEQGVADWPPDKEESINAMIASGLSYGGKCQALALSLGGVHLKQDSRLYQTKRPYHLLDIHYDHLSLLPINLSPEEKRSISQETSVAFLHLGTEAIETKSPCITLSESDQLRLAACPPPDDEYTPAEELLNEWLAMVRDIEPDNIFQLENGLPMGAVLRHFVGRDEQVNQINNTLKDADTGGNGSILVLGARRSGKTSLRQHVVARIKQEQSSRIVIDMDCQKWVPTSAGMIEQRFFETVAEILMSVYGEVFRYKWIYRGRQNEQSETRIAFEVKMKGLKEGAGYAPLILFDETDILTTTYAGRNDGFFTWLRGLSSGGTIAWYVNAFPYGASQPYSVQALRDEHGSPLYNTFGKTIRLGPWRSGISWSFLRSRLACLGIRLPSAYRDEVQTITKGIPWITHQLGLALSKANHKGVRRIIQQHQWRAARKMTNQNVKKVLSKVFDDAAANIEKRERVKIDEVKLSEGILLDAVKKLAEERASDPEKSFTLVDVHRLVGNRKSRELIKDILDSITNSAVLEGDMSSGHYHFAHGIFPRLIRDGDERDD